MRDNDNIHVKRLKEDRMGTLLECLRYAGIIYDIKEEYVERKDGEIDTYYSFEILPPKSVHAVTWKKMNSLRMRSFSVLTK